MIRLQAVRKEDRDLLWNINQKYLYEMTLYYPDPMDGKGNLHYGHFDEYFTDPRREAFFLFDDDTMVGFAMLCPYSYIGRNPDYTLAEFTIFPSCRRRHYAWDAVHLILKSHPGHWEIKYNEKNAAAGKLWTAVAAPYHPAVHRLNEEETVLEFANLPKSMPVKVQFYDQVDDRKLRFAVIVTRTEGHWVFCRHRERSTLEVPGGHREPGEDILTTAGRELHEETGAIDFSIEPVCAYSVTAPWNFNGEETFGMLFCADVKAFEKELHSEIQEIVIQDDLPSAWTYPEIQPLLMQEVQERRKMTVPVVAEEVSLTEDVLAELTALSKDWEAENSCYGYRANQRDDLEGKRIFLARKQGRTVGYLFGKCIRSEHMRSIMPEGSSCFEVEEIYVVPSGRSQGTGKALFEFASDAVSGEADYMTLSTATKNWKAISHFYLDELGMTFWSARMFKRIGKGGAE